MKLTKEQLKEIIQQEYMKVLLEEIEPSDKEAAITAMRAGNANAEKKLYRSLLRKYHPDLGGSSEDLNSVQILFGFNTQVRGQKERKFGDPPPQFFDAPKSPEEKAKQEKEQYVANLDLATKNLLQRTAKIVNSISQKIAKGQGIYAAGSTLKRGIEITNPELSALSDLIDNYRFEGARYFAIQGVYQDDLKRALLVIKDKMPLTVRTSKKELDALQNYINNFVNLMGGNVAKPADKPTKTPDVSPSKPRASKPSDDEELMRSLRNNPMFAGLFEGMRKKLTKQELSTLIKKQLEFVKKENQK